MNNASLLYRKESGELNRLTNENTFSHDENAGWDVVVLTASNIRQAENYRYQIRYRIENGLLPAHTHFAVVPDYKNTHIGSGGATFNVLRFINEITGEEDCFSKLHILTIHSGGESVRIPQYTVCGKLFAPIQRELSRGISATLFDEIFNSVKTLPSRSPAGMLTLSGDVLLVFDPTEVDLEECDAAAITAREDIDTGANHGVFIPDKQCNVKKFLHKLAVEDLKKNGAQGEDGKIHIDTGAVWFSSEVVKTLFHIICTGKKVDLNKFEMFVNEKERLSFYADMVYPIATEATLELYMKEKPEGDNTEQLAFCRTVLFDALHGYKMKLIEPLNAEFIHFGTTSELLELMTAGIEKYHTFGWSKVVNSHVDNGEQYTVNGSTVDRESVIGNSCYIENSRLKNVTIGDRCIISNIVLTDTEIPKDTVLHCLKQKNGRYIVRIFGIDDNPKKTIEDGGMFHSIPLADYMKMKNVTADELWDSKPFSLWNAKLFLEADHMDASLRHALCIYHISVSGDCWPHKQKLFSLKQSSENADFSSIWITGQDPL